MSEPLIDLLVVGNCCHDTLITRDGKEHQVLGGSASYIASVLRALGASFRVVAKVGADFRYHDALPFQPGVEGKRSTAFLDDYRSGDRRETLEAPGPRITPRDIDGRYRVAIACGVAGEGLPETLREMRARAEVVLADAQGLVRAFGAGGEVRVQPLSTTPFASALGAIDWLKIGNAELACVDPQELRASLLYTHGARGCLLEERGPDGTLTRHHVPPFPAFERDATGAGDCFLAGFAYALVRGLSPVRAARVGSFCGARAVEVVGVPTLDATLLAPLLAAS